MAKVVVRSGPGLTQEITAGLNSLVSDEPVAAGGGGEGPDPYSLLLAALGACTSMTLELYAQRKGMIEPVFGRIKQARGFRQFLLRGLEKLRSEWRLVCLTHNLLKLYRSGLKRAG